MLEDEAYELETQLIQKYGRMVDGGILTNICIDEHPPIQYGEANHRYGTKWSDKHKQRLSEIAILNGNMPPAQCNPMSQEQKDAIGAGNRGKKRTKEQSEYLSSIRKGKSRGPTSEDTKEKIRLGNIAAKADKRLSEDFTGMIFSSWSVIKKSRDMRPKIRGANGIWWKCKCSCGNDKEIQQSQLTKAICKCQL
jgi:hypothetical protein